MAVPANRVYRPAMLLLLLAACPAPSSDDADGAGDTADTAVPDSGEPCSWDTPTETELAWDAPTSTGVSAADLLSFGVGTFTATLAWDDGTTTDLTLEITPVGAREISVGPPETCQVSVIGLVTWTLTTADARLDVTGEGEWFVEEARLDQQLGAVQLNAELDRATIGFTPFEATSSLGVGIALDDAGVLDVAWVGESWQVDDVTTRVCKRASTWPDDELECVDHTDDTGMYD